MAVACLRQKAELVEPEGQQAQVRKAEREVLVPQRVVPVVRAVP